MQLVSVQKQHLSKEIMLSNIFIFSWSLKKKKPIIARVERKSGDNLLKTPSGIL